MRTDNVSKASKDGTLNKKSGLKIKQVLTLRDHLFRSKITVPVDMESKNGYGMAAGAHLAR